MPYIDFTHSVEVNTPALNTAAVVTLAADPKTQFILRKVFASYSGTPTGGRVTIACTPVGTQAAPRTFDIDLTAGGEHPYAFDLVCALNTGITITLFAGGAGIGGKLNVFFNAVKVQL